MDWTALTGSNGIAAIKMLLELEEKKHKKGQADLTNSRGSSKSKGVKSADSGAEEGARPEVVPAQETTGPANVPEAVDVDVDTQPKEFVPPLKASDPAETPATASSPADNQQKHVTPAAKAFDTAVLRVEDSVAGEGSGGNFTPAVKAEILGDATVVEPEAEPVEV